MIEETLEECTNPFAPVHAEKGQFVVHAQGVGCENGTADYWQAEGHLCLLGGTYDSYAVYATEPQAVAAIEEWNKEWE